MEVLFFRDMLRTVIKRHLKV